MILDQTVYNTGKGWQKMMWKASRYNLYDEEQFSYVANTLTGAYIQVDREELDRIKSGRFEEFNNEDLAVLSESGIIVDSRLDEMQLLRNAYNTCKYSDKKALITIALSLGCNFDCPYCYENKSNEYMSEETQNQVLGFLDSLLTENPISELSVCWYGGEPTLHMEALKDMSDKLIAVCEKRGIDYEASIITNGYLVDDSMSDTFRQCRIKSAQVTLDGTKKTHNARRKLTNGSGTYEEIVNAVFLLAERGIHVRVRVNLDKSNIHEYKDVYEIFEGQSNIVCYPTMVTVEETQSAFQQSLCFRHAEFEQFYDTIYSDIYGETDREPAQELEPVITNCIAEHAYSYLIAPDGHLYKCLNDICSSEWAVGHVGKGLFGTASTAKYLGRDPFTEPECEECPYIPVCYGGCVYEYEKHKTHACNSVRFMYKKHKIGGGSYEGDHRGEKQPY